jgi:hypothetical protein
VAVPLATYTGWNFRNPSIGQPGELLPLTGSYIPFAVTKAAREEARDPRLSIEERYGNRAVSAARDGCRNEARASGLSSERGRRPRRGARARELG